MIFLKGKPYPFRVDSASLKLMGVLPVTSVAAELGRDQGRADGSTQCISSISAANLSGSHERVFFFYFSEKFTLNLNKTNTEVRDQALLSSILN